MPTTSTKVTFRFPDETEYTLTINIETPHLMLLRWIIEKLVSMKKDVIEMNEIIAMFRNQS